MNENRPRRFAREAALLVLFEHSFCPEKSADELFEELYACDELADISTQKDYFEQVVHGVLQDEQHLTAEIEQYAQGWKVSRISRVAVAALKIAIFEIEQMPDIDDKVSANEAIELIKTYDMDDAAKFANGILGGYMKNRGE